MPHSSRQRGGTAYGAAASGSVAWNAVSNTAMCGTSGSARRAASTAATAGPLWSGASSVSAPSSFSTSSSITIGSRKRVPPCTILWATASTPLGTASSEATSSLVSSPATSESFKLVARETVRMLRVRLEAHEVDDIDDAHLQVGEPLAQDRDGGQRLQRRNVAAAREDDVRLGAVVVRRPVPDADSARAMDDRVVHREVLQRGLLAGDDHVHVVAAAQAVVGH